MNKRARNLVLILIIGILLCGANLPITDGSCIIVSDASSTIGQVQDQSLSPILNPSFSDLGTPELIRGHRYGPLFSLKTQTKGRESLRTIVRLLLLFVLVFCLLQTAFRHLRYRLLLPEDADDSSIILYFIHNKDGKK